MENSTQSRDADNMDSNNDYDPYLHRKVKKPTTYFESLAHLVKGVLGTGILAMPAGIARAGLIPGLAISLLAAAMMTHCMRVLIQQEYYQAKLSRVPYLTYRDALATGLRRGPEKYRKFAKTLAICVDFFLGFYHTGTGIVYMIFLAESLKQLVDPIRILPYFVYMIIILFPLLGLNLIPHLKYLAPFSVAANFVTLIGIVIVIYFLLSYPKLSDKGIDLWGSPIAYPLYFGTILFALAAVGVLVEIENNMKKPQQFCPKFGVLNVGMTFLTVLYLLVAILGYNFCRDRCADMITLNMPPGSWLADAVVIMFVMAITVSYPLNVYVPSEIIYRYVERRYPDASEKRKMMFNLIIRAILPIFTFIIALLVPKIGLFISLFGAFCLSAMAIIFPMLMEAVTRPRKIVLIKDIIIMLCGVMVMITGTGTALSGIVRSMTESSELQDETE